MAKIVGVKFNHTCKLYYFDPKDIEFVKGDGVIVETAMGTEYGVVAIANREVADDKVVQPLKPVIRKATEKDKQKTLDNEKRVPEIIATATREVEKLKLDMRVIDAECPFDNSKIVIYFSAPGRVDFRDLVKALSGALHNRIELHQVGTRDETKILGGIAPCGRVCCCKAFLPDFKKVTIKMAKNQGLSLNPAKISGLCGRLMCCLEYENEPYSEAYKKMPKVGSEVTTPDGKSTVISNNMLKMTVKTRAAQKDGTLVYKDYDLKDVKFNKQKKVEKDDDESEISD